MKQAEIESKADFLWRRASALEDRGEIDLAVKLYTDAARLGEPIAQSNLANLLDDKVSPARPKEAVYWYKRALKAGHEPAAWNLAMHYRNAGKKRWYLYWLRVAAELGDEDAQALLQS